MDGKNRPTGNLDDMKNATCIKASDRYILNNFLMLFFQQYDQSMKGPKLPSSSSIKGPSLPPSRSIKGPSLPPSGRRIKGPSLPPVIKGPTLPPDFDISGPSNKREREEEEEEETTPQKKKKPAPKDVMETEEDAIDWVPPQGERGCHDSF